MSAEDVETNYEDPVIKYDTVGNLENSKRAFFTDKDSTILKTELSTKPYQLYHIEYKYSSDYDGSMDFVARNVVHGMMNNYDSFRKYMFMVYRCYVVDNKRQYKYDGYVVSNTSDIQKVLGDKYDDFTWTQMTDIDEFMMHFVNSTEENLLHESYLH